MKKTLIKIISAVLLCGAFALIAPKQDVQAYTGTWDMNYEEACTYWSATPLWKQMYDLESAKSGYLDNAKADLKTYFKVTLNDYIWKPDAVAASRPLTANFMRDMLKLTNPNIVNVVRGSVNNGSLAEVLRNEVRSMAPDFSGAEVNACAAELGDCLGRVGVGTIGQYDDWKAKTGCTAFEFFMGCCYRGHYCNHHHHSNHYRYYCGPWGWGWYFAAEVAMHDYAVAELTADCHMEAVINNVVSTVAANENTYIQQQAAIAEQANVIQETQLQQIEQMQNLFK